MNENISELMENHIKIVVLDYYMRAPLPGLDVCYSEFRGAAVSQVPVLRCFGSNGLGKKICVHIHGVFPYLYIPYDGFEDATELSYKLASNIDKTLNVAMNQTMSNTQHVYKIALVSGIPMYGYHFKKHQFFKIYLYNPMLLTKLCSLLLNQSIMGKVWQPHEAHLNFTLQFMIDYNLHGMSNMIVENLRYRVDSAIETNCDNFLPYNINKITTCEIEGDINAQSILNRQEIISGKLAVNPGIAALWEDEKQRRRNKNETSQLGQFIELRNMDTATTKSHNIFKEALLKRLALSSKDEINESISPQDISVYPAEAPDDRDIQNASLVDLHTPSPYELSLDNTSFNVSLDLTVSESELNMTLEACDKEFLNMLQEMTRENEKIREEDSILSQTVREDEDQENNESTDMLDLTLSLEELSRDLDALNDTINVNSQIPDDDTSDGDSDIFNTTIVPQLDGHSDEVLNTVAGKSEQEYMCNVDQIGSLKPKVKSMPSLDHHFCPQPEFNSRNNSVVIKDLRIALQRLSNDQSKLLDVPISKRGKNKRTQSAKVSKKKRVYVKLPKIEKELRSFEFRIRDRNRKERLRKMSSVLRKKDKRLGDLIGKNIAPKFHAIPGIKWFLARPRKQRTIIAEMLIQTKNYIDPNLHLIIETPESPTHLYFYGGRVVPDVVEVPCDILKYERNFICSSLSKIQKIKVLKHVENKEKYVFSKSEIVLPQATKIHQNRKLIILLKDVLLNQNRSRKDFPREKEVSKTRYVLNPASQIVQLALQQKYNSANVALQEHLKCLKESSLLELKPNKEVLGLSFNIVANENYDPKINMLLQKVNDVNKNIIKTEHICDNFEPHYNIKHKNNDVHFVVNGSDVAYNNNNFFSDKNGMRSFKKSNVDTNRSRLLSENISVPHRIPGEIDDIKVETFSNKKGRNKELINNNEFESTYHRSTTNVPTSKDCYVSIKRLDDKFFETKFEIPKILRINPESSKRQKRPHAEVRNIQPTVAQHLAGGKVIPAKCRSSLNFKTTHGIEETKNNNIGISSDRIQDSNPVTHHMNHSFKKRGYIKRDFKILLEDFNKFQENFPMLDRNKLIPSRDKLIYLNCDGTFDSSSSEDEGYVLKSDPRKSSKRSHVSQENLNFEEAHDLNFQMLGHSTHVELDSYKKPQKGQALETQDFSEESSRQSDDAQDLNTSFFQKYCLNLTAKEYDQQTGFVAKESCSKFLTPEESCLTKKETDTFSKDMHDEQTGFAAKEGYSKFFTPEESCLTEKKTDISGEDMHYAEFDEKIDIPNRIFVEPTLRAPTKEQVEKSLSSYQIESVRHEGPFYSDVEDCTSAVEVGQTVLRIPSRTTVHLEEFESFTDGLTKFRRHFVENVANLRWNQKNVKQLSLNYCGDKCLVLTPVKKAPSVKQVEQWIEDNLKFVKKQPKHRIQKSKIYLENEDDEEFPLSLTLSPPSTQASSELFSNEVKEKEVPILKDSLILTQNTSHSFGVTGVTPSSFDFDKSVQNLQTARSVIEYQYLTTLVMELHFETRGNLKPDPEYDKICAVFYTCLNDFPEQEGKHLRSKGVYAVNSANNKSYLNGIGVLCEVVYTNDELSLINQFLKFVLELDPDILAGYEIQMLSWGYFVERARFLGINILPMLGRSEINRFSKFQKENMTDFDLESAVTGRIVLDVWRLMRHEVALQSYTFESIVYTVLHRRVPKYSFKELSSWWDHNTQLYRHRVVRYYLYQVESILELLQKLDFINRTSELAKLFGIMFYEVLSRGTQFRVESMMLRLAKPLNYIPVSPSQMQRANMKAPEFIPLVMEPESKMYNDPVIVLDFQSLYPSIIIAYNYCFTTCMGRIECLGKNIPFEFGSSLLKVSRRVVEKLAKRDLVNYSPCGVAFVKRKVREGILPRMLKEILDTRLMVKNSMKENKSNNILQKVLHNRQLGLKLIANVTYGYTAANFSGRMCCVEVGDSVVSKGRETLQRAISMVDSTKEWGARVVYGDTDSLFVCIPGKSRETAFEIGKKIADAVSNDNPDPVKLKLEKVYQPCILQTKKRYVGYMYESPDQNEPIYDAKGIETVRRDGCPAVSKMLEKCLHLLFETKDVSLIKKYVIRQFSKIQAGKASIQDLTFAKEYRGAAGYKPGACVPSLELARKWKSTDRRNEPRSGERVPYVITNGPPGLPLIRLVRSPYELLNDSSLRLNSLYYITKVIIPPINRCLSLIGADVNIWFNQMPRKNTIYLQPSSPILGAKTTLSQYFANKICASCSQATKQDLCEKCVDNPVKTTLVLLEKIAVWERKYDDTKLICQSCTGCLFDTSCISLDCPVLYRRTQNHRELQQASYLRDILNSKEIFSRKK